MTDVSPAVRIAAQDLRLEYRDETRGECHVAVDGLSLEVLADEFLCVVGPSGCGKSTLISAIAGILKPAPAPLCWTGDPSRAPAQIAASSFRSTPFSLG